MADLKTLTVTRRNGMGQGPNRRLRAQSLIPAIFYNAEGLNIPIQAELLPLQKLYSSVRRTTVFNLEIDDNGSKTTYPALFWQVQYHPLKGIFSHIDFFGVDLNREIRIHVPLEFSGTAKGTKVGGHLEIYREHLDVMAKPLSLPNCIQVNVADLGIGDTLNVSDLNPGDGVTVMAPANLAIASVVVKGAESASEENV